MRFAAIILLCILATWWVGLLLGIPLACAARLGSRPKLTAPDLLRPIALLLATMACIAALAGIVGHIAATRHWAWLLEPLASRVPADRHIAFLTALWAHSASYAAGFLGGPALSAHPCGHHEGGSSTGHRASVADESRRQRHPRRIPLGNGCRSLPHLSRRPSQAGHHQVLTDVPHAKRR